MKPVPDDTRDYADLNTDYWAYSYVRTLTGYGIIAGYPQPDGTFTYEPEQDITRAEIMKLIAASLELQLLDGFDGSRFADWGEVADWAKPYVGALVNAGIVAGSQEGDRLLINADSNVTRQEMIAMAIRALDIDMPEEVNPGRRITDFDDADNWAKRTLAFAVNNAMINVDNSAANPKNAAKRSEAAMMLYKMIEYRTVNGS